MTPFLFFITLVILFVGGVAWFLHSAWETVRTQAAQHAAAYAVSYVKCTALVGIAMGAAFVETFKDLSQESADRMSWWGWIVYFWKPLAAGLAVLVAFLDRSAERARVARDDPKTPTNPPFPHPKP